MQFPPGPMLLCAMLCAMLLTGGMACTQPSTASSRPPSAPIPPDPSRPILHPFPPGIQRGICYAHAWEHADDGGYGSEADRRTLQRLKALGVDAISLTPFAFQHARNSDAISGMTAQMRRAESDERVKASAAFAKSLGMKVLLKPHVWVGDGSWCGAITPPSWPVWMASYQAVAVHYATLAQAMHADGYLIGNELKTATSADPNGFRALIRAVRKEYTGPLSYAANWDEAGQILFWDELDAVGVNAYWPLTSHPNATDTEREAGARHVDAILSALAEKTRRPILITELGYRSVAGSDVDPHTWPEQDRDRAVDFEAQSKAYQAILSALWRRPYLRGIYFWKVISDGSWQEDGGSRGFSPLDKPAEQVLRQYYSAPPSSSP